MMGDDGRWRSDTEVRQEQFLSNLQQVAQRNEKESLEKVATLSDDDKRKHFEGLKHEQEKTKHLLSQNYARKSNVLLRAKSGSGKALGQKKKCTVAIVPWRMAMSDDVLLRIGPNEAMKRWRKRHLVLERGGTGSKGNGYAGASWRLLLFQDATKAKLTKVANVRATLAVAHGHATQPYSFVVEAEDGSFRLDAAAPTAAKKQAWLAALSGITVANAARHSESSDNMAAANQQQAP